MHECVYHEPSPLRWYMAMQCCLGPLRMCCVVSGWSPVLVQQRVENQLPQLRGQVRPARRPAPLHERLHLQRCSASSC